MCAFNHNSIGKDLQETREKLVNSYYHTNARSAEEEIIPIITIIIKRRCSFLLKLTIRYGKATSNCHEMECLAELQRVGLPLW
jgi:hypothetical protein